MIEWLIRIKEKRKRGVSIMAERTSEERIAELDKRIEQIKAQKKAILAREKQAERKARTKRLIEVGATVESVLGRPIEQDELPKLLNFLKQQEERGQYFTKAMS
jgi:predicted Zn-dependent protease